MKKISEKSFRILKVVVLIAVVTACGLYYVLFVDGEMPKAMETTAKKEGHISKDDADSPLVVKEVKDDDFIIEVIPVDDDVATRSMTSLLYQSEGVVEEKVGIDAQGRVNINVASSEELQTLKNIGPVVASNIISYREEYGDFLDIKDIKNVKGIGDAKYNTIKDSIYVK